VPNVSVVAIVAAYNEADIIGQVVGDLIDQGVSVYFIDNRSTDATLATVRCFEGRGVVGIETYPKQPTNENRFDWSGLLSRKEELATELDADWFIHHDADEFRESPWAGVDLRTAIEVVDQLGFNAIDFELLEFQLTNRSLAGGNDVRSALPYFAEAAPFNKVQIRCWKARGKRVDLRSSGGHEAHFDGRQLFPFRFIVRHYPFRSVEQAKRKVLVDRRPRFDPLEREKGWHMHYDDFGFADNQFIRDADGLQHFDPHQIRHDLRLRDRGSQAANPAGGAVSALVDEHRQLQQDHDRLRQQCEQAERARDASESHAVRQAQRVDSLQEQLMSSRQEIERVQSITAEQKLELRHFELLATTTRDSLAAATKRILALESSISWRITAPGRRLIDWLMRWKDRLP